MPGRLRSDADAVSPRCCTFHTVSDGWWTWVGIAVAVVLVVAGLWLAAVVAPRPPGSVQRADRPATRFRARRRRGHRSARASAWRSCSTRPSSRVTADDERGVISAGVRAARLGRAALPRDRGARRRLRPDPRGPRARASTSCAPSAATAPCARSPRRWSAPACRWGCSPAAPATCSPATSSCRPTTSAAPSTVAITGRNRHIDVGWLRLDPRRGAPRGARRRGLDGRAPAARVPRHGRPRARRRDHGQHLRELKAKIGWTAYVPAGLKNLLVERFKAAPVGRRRAALDDAGPHRARSATAAGSPAASTSCRTPSPTTARSTSSSSPRRASPRGWPSRPGCSPRASRSTQTLDRYRCQSVERAGRPRAEDRARRRHHRRGHPRQGRGAAARPHRAHRVGSRGGRLTGARPCRPAQNLRSRHCRSNGSRHVYGAMSWWIWLGPQVPCA